MAVTSLNRRRWNRFLDQPKAKWSLILLGFAFVISLFAELWINDKPLYVHYKDNHYFPVFFYYPGTQFGQPQETSADYFVLRKTLKQNPDLGFALMPLVPHSPLHPYLDYDDDPPHAPSGKHWLGTDATGRDIFARLVYGFRICMLFSLALTFASTVLAVFIGAVQGYQGGKTDLIMQRLIEIWASLPFLYVVILFGEIYGRHFLLLLVLMALFQWIGLSYYMRGEFLKLKEFTFVKASKTLGMSKAHILFKEILPNALTPVITFFPFQIIGGISALTSLDFLGFGLQPPTPSWGELLSQGLQNLYAPWIAASAIGALFITLLLATFIGEGFRDAFDPA